ncbi:MAG TPA: DUF2336 domain-containing protein [Alphaproteobacteria bacterium]|nr:DUF2336 domain-containing protein [Alphaproteobacteria bacterium]
MSAPDYEKAKALARDPDPAVRRKLAAQIDTRPELLYYLAEDAVAPVRVAIAANPSTPRQADALLSRDRDDEVRVTLAGKIARLVPQMSGEAHQQMARLTFGILETLARDQAVAVREILAETLKDMPSAPPHIVQQLARDLEIRVSAPVLTHSPVLGDDDLLSIISANPVPGALAAIARRGTVSGNVADAIAGSTDEAAIAVLLANPSAQIREATLDHLIERAPGVEAWHEPLVRRPKLPPGAVRKLAKFVADSLLSVLEARPDLDSATAQQLADTVRQRLAAKAAEPAEAAEGGKAKPSGPEPERPSDRARRLNKEGKLDEAAVAAAVSGADRAFVLAALAELAGIDMALAEQVMRSQSPRGVVALVWRCGLSMRLALQVQLRIARIAPNQALNPRGGSSYPLSPDEMEWQLEFFGIPGKRKAGKK